MKARSICQKNHTRRYSLYLQQLSEEEIDILERKDMEPYKRLPFSRQYSPWVSRQWKLFRQLLHQSYVPLVNVFHGVPPDWSRTYVHMLIMTDFWNSKKNRVAAVTIDDVQRWFDDYLELVVHCGDPHE